MRRNKQKTYTNIYTNHAQRPIDFWTTRSEAIRHPIPPHREIIGISYTMTIRWTTIWTSKYEPNTLPAQLHRLRVFANIRISYIIMNIHIFSLLPYYDYSYKQTNKTTTTTPTTTNNSYIYYYYDTSQPSPFNHDTKHKSTHIQTMLMKLAPSERAQETHPLRWTTQIIYLFRMFLRVCLSDVCQFERIYQHTCTQTQTHSISIWNIYILVYLIWNFSIRPESNAANINRCISLNAKYILHRTWPLKTYKQKKTRMSHT